jgi:hypothetical protein
VVLHGQLLATQAGARQLRLSAAGLGSRRHRVQVLATDIDGQATLTPPAALLVDGQPPVVTVARGRGRLTVRVHISDGGSGVAKGRVRVSFGDGHRAGGRARFSHRYARGGAYQVVVSARDRLGNSELVRQLVHVK